MPSLHFLTFITVFQHIFAVFFILLLVFFLNFNMFLYTFLLFLTLLYTFLSTAIIISSKKKEMLYKVWKMKPDCTDLKNEYKNYSKLLDKGIKGDKFKFERHKIARSSNDPKKLLEIINNKLCKTKKANKTIDCIYVNKNKIVNKEDIANLMNTYICVVGANLSKNVKQLLCL